MPETFMPSADVSAILLDGRARWNVAGPLGTPIFVTYSFGNSKAAYDTEARPGYATWTEQHKIYVRQALQTWEAASGIKFLEVPDTALGQIRLNMYDETGLVNAVGNQLSGLGYYPSYSFNVINGNTVYLPYFDNIGGDIFLNSIFFAANAASIAPGSQGYIILVHEIGHTLGFKHPFEGSPTIEPAHNNSNYTVLAYNLPASQTTLGSVDIEASQYYYGTADSNYVWDSVNLVLTQFGTAASEVRLGTELTDVIYGFAGADVIRGEWGDDYLDGGAGNDSIDGGLGYDKAAFTGNSTSFSFSTSGPTATIASSIGEVDTATAIEEFVFSNGSFRLSDSASTASANFVQPAITGILRYNPSTLEIAIDGQTLDRGVTQSTYLSQLISLAENTTIPSLIVPDFVNGITPTSSHLDALTAFSQAQYNYYFSRGVLDPSIAAYEAIGMGLAETAPFGTRFGGGTDQAFITSTYQSAFGRAPLTSQVTHFQNQLDYFEGLYLSAGITSSVAVARARGAVVGQMLGFASHEAGNDYHDAAVAFLQDASNGTTNYGIDLIGIYG
jgi:hypothetical protein